MARKKRNYDYDEYDDEEYEDEDEYEDEYEEDYDDYEDEPYRPRNPLKPLVVVMLLLMLVMAALVGILYLRLQTANNQVSELTNSLNATRTELNNLLAERTNATPEPPQTTPEPPSTEPDPTPDVTPTPEPTPTPGETATPEPTSEPTPTPELPLSEAVTDEALAGTKRPYPAAWYDKPQYSVVSAEFMLSVRWGPGPDWNERFVLYHDDMVEVVASQDGWKLLRTQDGQYGWALGTLIRDATEAEIAAANGTESTADTPAETGTDDGGDGGETNDT